MIAKTSRQQVIGAIPSTMRIIATACRNAAQSSHIRVAAHVYTRLAVQSVLAAGAILLFAGCDRLPALQPEEGTAQDALLRSVRQATARFHSTTQAVEAGYQPTYHCVAVAGRGGMGYHWVNPAFIDPSFEPLQPEALLYATKEGGALELVGLEYIVLNVGQAAPVFGEQPFDVGGVGPLDRDGVAHWSLHVWLYEENPAGLFAPFNPNVTCP